MQADLRANGLSEVLYVDMLVFCEARRDQVEVRRQRQEKSVQLSLSKVASLRAAVNWAQRLTQLPDLPGGCRLVHQQLDRAQALPGAGEYMADSQDRKKTVLVQDPALIQMKPSCLPAPLSHPTALSAIHAGPRSTDVLLPTCSAWMSLCIYCSKGRIIWLITALHKKISPRQAHTLGGDVTYPALKS